MGVQAIAKRLMQKTVAFASGDEECMLRIVGPSVYDPVTGTVDESYIDYVIANPLFGPVNENDVKRFELTETTHTVILADAERTRAGAPIPHTGDYVLVSGKLWNIERVVIDSLQSGVAIFVHEA